MYSAIKYTNLSLQIISQQTPEKSYFSLLLKSRNKNTTVVASQSKSCVPCVLCHGRALLSWYKPLNTDMYLLNDILYIQLEPLEHVSV